MLVKGPCVTYGGRQKYEPARIWPLFPSNTSPASRKTSSTQSWNSSLS